MPNPQQTRLIRKTGLFSALCLLFLVSSFAPALWAGTLEADPSNGNYTYWETKKKERIDVIDPDAPPEATDAAGKFIKFGGRVSFDYDEKRNYDLSKKDADAFGAVSPSVALSTTITPTKNISLYGSMSFSKDFTTIEKGGDRGNHPFELNVNQVNLTVRDLPVKNLSFVVGRQRYQDERQWVINETSDGFRLSYKLKKLTIDSGMFFQGILDKDIINDESDPRVDNYYLSTEYRFSKKFKIRPYGLIRRDHSPDQEQMFFFGFHSSGEIIRHLEYWTELGSSLGKERIEDDATGGDRLNTFAGVGFDIGTRYEFANIPFKPSIIASYAFGSGDNNPGDNIDEGFRQSGLEGNSDSINGVSKVNYYGELFNPELSNLMVLTTGIAMRPIKKASIQFLYHEYIQHHASPNIRDSSIHADPDGLSNRLGSEVDFVLALKNIKRFDFTATLGMFVPDKGAFEEAETIAFLAKMRTRFNF